MSLSWPWALLSILVIPLIFAIRAWARRRRRRAAVRVTSIALVRSALPGRTRWTRRIPAALFVAGLALLAAGAARPQASLPVPMRSATVLLALDVSGSMCSTDVDPNRITAAKKAAAAFIRSMSGGPRIGLVAFAHSANLIVPPTDDTDALVEALDGLTTSLHTAIGQAVLASIDAIAEVDPSVPATGVPVTEADPGERDYAAAAIVVLTDGANTRGVAPQTAAREAALRRVRVFTIGFGTTHPGPMVCDGSQVDGLGGFGGGGFGGGFRRDGRDPFTLDEPALKQMAETTGGSYRRAENAAQLTGALHDLPGAFTVVRRQVDTAAAFAGGGAVLIAAALGLSLWWNRPRVPGGRERRT